MVQKVIMVSVPISSPKEALMTLLQSLKSLVVGEWVVQKVIMCLSHPCPVLGWDT